MQGFPMVVLCGRRQRSGGLVQSPTLHSPHRYFIAYSGKQKWANVLEKAIAKAIGGYEQLLKAETGDLFMLLTGCNSIGVKVKEDPSKNGKLLQLIGDCQRKNYIVHA